MPGNDKGTLVQCKSSRRTIKPSYFVECDDTLVRLGPVQQLLAVRALAYEVVPDLLAPGHSAPNAVVLELCLLGQLEMSNNLL